MIAIISKTHNNLNKMKNLQSLNAAKLEFK